MVSSSFICFDWGFYFWSGVVRSQCTTYDTLMRRYISHIRKQAGLDSGRYDGIIKRSHRRVRSILIKE